MIRIDINGQTAAQLRLERAPGNVQRRVVKIVAKKALELSKNRVKNQTDLQGRAWQARKSGQRKKMLVKLGRLLKIVATTDSTAEIGWANRLTATIAGKHQFGSTETFNKSQFRDRQRLSSSDPATRAQAKALLDAGYKIRRANGRGHKTPTIKWIVANLNVGRAGVILRALRGTKQSWPVVLPPRSFLGVTDAELADLTALAMNEALGVL
jgi:phage gpG-like protein